MYIEKLLNYRLLPREYRVVCKSGMPLLRAFLEKFTPEDAKQLYQYTPWNAVPYTSLTGLALADAQLLRMLLEVVTEAYQNTTSRKGFSKLTPGEVANRLVAGARHYSTVSMLRVDVPDVVHVSERGWEYIMDIETAYDIPLHVTRLSDLGNVVLDVDGVGTFALVKSPISDEGEIRWNHSLVFTDAEDITEEYFFDLLYNHSTVSDDISFEDLNSKYQVSGKILSEAPKLREHWKFVWNMLCLLSAKNVDLPKRVAQYPGVPHQVTVFDSDALLPMQGSRGMRKHLRRGHFHLYWTGKGRKVPRINFVAPTLVGGDHG